MSADSCSAKLFFYIHADIFHRKPCCGNGYGQLPIAILNDISIGSVLFGYNFTVDSYVVNSYEFFGSYGKRYGIADIVAFFKPVHSCAVNLAKFGSERYKLRGYRDGYLRIFGKNGIAVCAFDGLNHAVVYLYSGYFITGLGSYGKLHVFAEGITFFKPVESGIFSILYYGNLYFCRLHNDFYG